ncbi:MAG: hypothetical protein GY816_15620 [Cytophagales bacterium]|nr:hypothetical protein [Cytophagales bacterium]
MVETTKSYQRFLVEEYGGRRNAIGTTGGQLEMKCYTILSGPTNHQNENRIIASMKRDRG